MKNLLRRVITLLLAAAIPASLLVITGQPAQAYTTGKRVELVGARLMAVKVTARAVQKNAFNASFTAMNYGDVDRVFRQHIGSYSRYTVEWRRQLATGWYQGGGRINNISAPEMRLIKARRQAIYGSSCPRCRGVDRTVTEPQIFRDPPTAACGTGESKGPVTHQPLFAGRYKYSVYLNSCQTDLYINDWETCVYNIGQGTVAIAAVMATIKRAAGKVPLVAVVAGIFSATCWHEANLIKRAQASSTKRAVIIRSNPEAIMHSNPNGGQYTDYAYYRQ